MRICAGDCKGNFCDECFPLASLSHVHGPTHFRSLNDEACPEIGFLPDGWRAMRNSEGKNYYLHDGSGHFTFEKPRLPDSLPDGWVAMLGTRDETVYVNKSTNTMSHVSPIFGVAPEGWDLKQTKTGRLFYVNRQTQNTTWHKPQPDDGDPLPHGWEAGRHADGRVYYINHLTKTNTWMRPTASSVQPSSQGPGPASPSTQGFQPTRSMSTTTQVRSAMNPVQPAMRFPVVAPSTNVQAMGSPVTLQGSVTIVPPQTATQMPGQNSVMVISAPQIAGQSPVTLVAAPQIAGPSPVTLVAAPQITGQGSAQVTSTQSVTPTHLQQTVSYPQGSRSTTVGSALNALAHNPSAQKAALHLGLAAINGEWGFGSGC